VLFQFGLSWQILVLSGLRNLDSNGILPTFDAEFNEFLQVIRTELSQEGATLNDAHLAGSE
jgi:hypothetical protein